MFFIGRNQNNHVPIDNGRVLCWLQQDNGQRPLDRLTQVFYPNYDLSSRVLGDEGSYLLVKLAHERIWYDPHGLVKEQPGQLGEIISVDDASFEGGNGIYRVTSHKGNVVVRTRTWVPPHADAVIRSFEVSTLKGNSTTATLYPVVHLPNLSGRVAHIYLSRLGDERWLAVTCSHAVTSASGDVGKAISGSGIAQHEHGSIPTPITFSASREIPAGAFSKPVYLVMGLGKNKTGAVRELKKVLQNKDGMFEETANYWNAWHSKGTVLQTSDPALDYLWRTSLTLLKTSLQENGLPIMIGFKPYQGNVWIRDSVWIIATLAATGHSGDAVASLLALRKLIKKRSDGNFYFAYNCVTRMPSEHSYENDSTGLLLYGIWRCYQATGDAGLIKEFQGLIFHCADWICRNLDETGMVKPCAGISEAFGPHLGRKFEHMVWTSGISAYGLGKAAEMAQALGHPKKAAAYRQVMTKLMEASYRCGVRQGILCRSRESDGLDASTLHFLTGELALWQDPELLRATVKAFEERLVDPFLGGVWRYEEVITEEGDLRPWLFYTFLLAQAYVESGEPDTGWRHLRTALDFRSYCGLFPELMYTRDLPRGVGMPSFSQCGFLRTMLGHADMERESLRLPSHLRWMRFSNLPVHGRLINLSTGSEEGD